MYALYGKGNREKFNALDEVVLCEGQVVAQANAAIPGRADGSYPDGPDDNIAYTAQS